MPNEPVEKPYFETAYSKISLSRPAWCRLGPTIAIID
jgi:hypothetical protein